MKTVVTKLLVAIALSTAVTGCATMAGSAGVNWIELNPGPVPNHEKAEAQAKEAIRYVLKDPDSAKFRDVTPFFKTLYNFGLAAAGNYEPLWALCVEVNAKNSYGGYTGFENWIVKFRNGEPVHGELGIMHADYDCKTGPVQAARMAN